MAFSTASMVLARVSLNVVPNVITRMASLFGAFFIAGFSDVQTPTVDASRRAGVTSLTSGFNS